MGEHCSPIFNFYTMKKIFFIIILFVICYKTNSQTFEKFIRTEYDEIVYDAIFFDSENVVFVLNQGLALTDYNIKLYKMNYSTSNIVDSLDVNFVFSNDYYLGSLYQILKYNDTCYIGLGSARHKTSDDYQLYIFHVNEDFKITFSTLSGSISESDLLNDYIINSDGNIVAVGKALTSKNNQFHNTFANQIVSNQTYNCISAKKTRGDDILFYECDIWGNQIERKLFNRDGIWATTIFEIPTLNKYHFYHYYNSDSNYDILDKESLEIDSSVNYPMYFLPRMAFPSANDSTYFVAGKEGGQSNSSSILKEYGLFYLSFLEISYNGNIISQNTYNTDSTTLFPFKTFASTEENIYISGNTPLVIPDYFAAEKRWILFFKLDIHGVVIWQKFYKGDVNYMPLKILATPDGGTLIFSTRYDWNDEYPYQRDVHILKIDSDGNYIPVGLTETQKNDKQILIYPNPATDVININLGLFTDLRINIYDINGCLVYKSLLKHSSSIDLQNFIPGVYIYKIFKNNEFIENGKFVKQ